MKYKKAVVLSDSFTPLVRIRGKKPVILQVIPELGPGGAEQGCVDMAWAIQAAGGRAIVASHGGIKSRLHELARAGGVHIDLPVHSKNPFTMWANIKRLQRVIHDHNVDIVHARSRAPAWSALEACNRTGVHFMTTCHAPYNTENALKRKYNSAIAQGERVIAISEYVADYLHREFRLGPDRIRIIHRGVALDRFHPTSVTPDRVIKITNEWRVPDGATVVLLPGRLTRWKGQHVLIDAIRQIDNPDVFAVLLGSDQGRKDYTTELHNKIRDYGLEGRVRIVDHSDDMPAAYMASHIVVSASIEPEGFGRIAIEGQAMGRVVIATNHGGSRETVVDNATGWLVKPDDAGDLARTLSNALALDLNERATLGTNGMMHVAQYFTREHMMNETLKVYNELLSERK